jgi:hypothetical protein
LSKAHIKVSKTNSFIKVYLFSFFFIFLLFPSREPVENPLRTLIMNVLKGLGSVVCLGHCPWNQMHTWIYIYWWSMSPNQIKFTTDSTLSNECYDQSESHECSYINNKWYLCLWRSLKPILPRNEHVHCTFCVIN